MNNYVNEYMKTVEKCPFYIHDFDYYFCTAKTDPQSVNAENYYFTGEANTYGYRSGVYVDSRIRNRAKQMIGGRLKFIVKYGYNLSNQFNSGFIYLLPPPTRCSATQAIDNMLAIFSGGELIESPPAWENKIDLAGLKEAEITIAQKEKEKDSLVKSINELKKTRKSIIEFR